MSYKLKFLPTALKEWKKLDNSIQAQFRKKLKERLEAPNVSSEDLTREQTEVMADKMVSNPRSPFHDPETFISNKIKVYKFFGMGQVHYIFCQEQLGYWISAPPKDGENLLLYFLKNG